MYGFRPLYRQRTLRPCVHLLPCPVPCLPHSVHLLPCPVPCLPHSVPSCEVPKYKVPRREVPKRKETPYVHGLG